MFVENFILNDIILFYLYFIVYFVIPMMFWVNVLLMCYIVIEPYYVLADGTANFIIYFNHSIVTRPDCSIITSLTIMTRTNKMGFNNLMIGK